MKYLAAYLLANLSEKGASTESIKKILTAAGIEAESSKIDTIVASLKGKDLQELIKEGNSKLASVPSGGAVASSGAGAAAPSGGAPAAAAAVEEAKEESDDDMGFGLFD